MRITRWILGIVGVFALFVVAAVLIATWVIDPNRYKPQIEKFLRELTGAPFTIHGNLEIAWYPWLGVRTGEARLGASEDGQPPLVQWQSIEVAAKLLPLLHGEVIVDRVRLQSPNIYLHRWPDGRGNWTELVDRLGRQTGAAPAKDTPPPQIAGFEIRGGALTYVDDRSGARWSLQDWQLDVGAWATPRPLNVRSRFTLHGGPLPPAGIPVEFDVSQLALTPEPLQVNIPKATVRLAEARLEGEATLANQDEQLRGDGQLNAQVPSMRQFLAVLGLEGSLPPNPQALGALQLRCRWNLAQGGVTLKPVSLQLDATRFDGWITRSAAAQPLWSFQLHGDQIDVGTYVAAEQKTPEPFEVPVRALKGLPAQGTLVFDRMRYDTTQMKDVRLRLEMQ